MGLLDEIAAGSAKKPVWENLEAGDVTVQHITDSFDLVRILNNPFVIQKSLGYAEFNRTPVIARLLQNGKAVNTFYTETGEYSEHGYSATIKGEAIDKFSDFMYWSIMTFNPNRTTYQQVALRGLKAGDMFLPLGKSIEKVQAGFFEFTDYAAAEKMASVIYENCTSFMANGTAKQHAVKQQIKLQYQVYNRLVDNPIIAIFAAIGKAIRDPKDSFAMGYRTKLIGILNNNDVTIHGGDLYVPSNDESGDGDGSEG